MYPAGNMQQPGSYYPQLAAPAGSNMKFVWIILALIAVGAGVGVTLAFVL